MQTPPLSTAPPGQMQELMPVAPGKGEGGGVEGGGGGSGEAGDERSQRGPAGRQAGAGQGATVIASDCQVPGSASQQGLCVKAKSFGDQSARLLAGQRATPLGTHLGRQWCRAQIPGRGTWCRRCWPRSSRHRTCRR
jgi:hypothetical protein